MRLRQPSTEVPEMPGLARHEVEVLRAIRDTAFGTVEITVHQSRIVQITRSEKVRFDQAEKPTR